jgi:intracellular septation protein
MLAQIRIKHSNPELVWESLNHLWALFFFLMGALNLYIAYNYDENTWVNFKLFGSLGLLIVFVIGQGIWLNQIIHKDQS